MKKSMLDKRSGWVMMTMLLLVSSLWAAEPTSLWSIAYQADVVPNDLNSIAFADGTFATMSTAYLNNMTSNEILTGGIYHLSTIDTNGGGFWNAYFSDVPQNLKPDSTTGYAVEIRAKLNATDENSNGACTFFCEEDTLGQTRYWSFFLKTDPSDGHAYVGIAGNSAARVTQIDYDWHTYYITAENDGIRLYIDSATQAVDFVPEYRPLVKDQWGFGDTTGSADGDWLIDYIRFYTGTCGDKAHPYPEGDITQDCFVDLADFAVLASNWMRCNDPQNPNCF